MSSHTWWYAWNRLYQREVVFLIKEKIRHNSNLRTSTFHSCDKGLFYGEKLYITKQFSIKWQFFNSKLFQIRLDFMNIHTTHGDRLLLGFPANAIKCKHFGEINVVFFCKKCEIFAHWFFRFAGNPN